MRDLRMEIVLLDGFLKNMKHLRRGTITGIPNIYEALAIFAGKGLKDLSISFLSIHPSL